MLKLFLLITLLNFSTYSFADNNKNITNYPQKIAIYFLSLKKTIYLTIENDKQLKVVHGNEEQIWYDYVSPLHGIYIEKHAIIYFNNNKISVMNNDILIGNTYLGHSHFAILNKNGKIDFNNSFPNKNPNFMQVVY